jgi:N-acetylmuramoyl-L-alanine amidase
MKIYLSPSSQEHNIGPGGYIEEFVMNKIADILQPELVRHGIEVKRNNPALTFREHVKESNLYKPDYHVALHSNASGSATPTARGLVIFCYDPTDGSRKGTQLARNIYKYLEPLTPVTDRGIRSGKDNLSEVAKTTAPAVLVEVDFHDTAAGAAWIASHIEEIAFGYLMGILDQCQIKYIPLPAPEPEPAGIIYRVQAGAFVNLDNAKALQDKLIRAGFSAYIKREEV